MFIPLYRNDCFEIIIGKVRGVYIPPCIGHFKHPHEELGTGAVPCYDKNICCLKKHVLGKNGWAKKAITPLIIINNF